RGGRSRVTEGRESPLSVRNHRVTEFFAPRLKLGGYGVPELSRREVVLEDGCAGEYQCEGESTESEAIPDHLRHQKAPIAALHGVRFAVKTPYPVVLPVGLGRPISTE